MFIFFLLKLRIVQKAENVINGHIFRGLLLKKQTYDGHVKALSCLCK